MGSSTSISWTDASWNPIRGCQRTAPKGSKQSGCGDASGGGCYAERQAARFCGPGQPYEGLIKLTANGPRWSGKTRFVRAHLMDPLRWRRPRKIFTDSMSDLFYEGIPTDQIDDIVAVMMISCLHEGGPGHIFQTLTKRPHRMLEYFTDPATQERVARAAGALMEDGDGWYDQIAFRGNGLLHSHMWWGTSVENQQAAEQRVPPLLSMPAIVRFLSIEPLLGPIDFAQASPNARSLLEDVNWVIAGCESGHGARECSVEWLREIRDQCAIASVPFFLKQAEESTDCGEDRLLEPEDDDSIAFDEGSKMKARRPGGNHIIELPHLDGKQHAAFPTPSTDCDR